jgi:hypothetical protein
VVELDILKRVGILVIALPAEPILVLKVVLVRRLVVVMAPAPVEVGVEVEVEVPIPVQPLKPPLKV